MAKESTQYRLWQHSVRGPKKDARTIIAKVWGGAPGRGAAAETGTGEARSGRAAGDDTGSRLTRLVADGYASRVAAVFDDAGPER
ncbi:MAG: hypothetical protein ACRERC_23165, partial [Candidatus Binatia bacterium]